MAKNLKGGYKIVSLNGLDLVGESLAIAGLYDKLAKSYDKPILVTGIVIDGEKKKNAFVQVEVLDDGIKINDLYGYDLLVEEDGDITVSANPQELPNTADASAGQILKLDAQKKPFWGDEAELPSTESASQGNALVLDAEKKPVWGAVSTFKLYKHTIRCNTGGTPDSYVIVYSTSSTPITSLSVAPSGTTLGALFNQHFSVLSPNGVTTTVYGKKDFSDTATMKTVYFNAYESNALIGYSDNAGELLEVYWKISDYADHFVSDTVTEL